MNTLNDFLSSINPTPKVEAAPIDFYIYASAKDYAIKGVSPIQSTDADIINLPIDQVLAEKFLSGKENLSSWVVGNEDNKIKLVKLSDVKEFHRNRVELLSLVQVKKIPQGANSNDYVIDVMIKINEDNDTIEIGFDGSKIANWTTPVKLYLTKQDAPSFLKGVISLDVNILDKIKTDNGLDDWPNPLIISVNDTSDLSIFTIKSPRKIALL